MCRLTAAWDLSGDFASMECLLSAHKTVPPSPHPGILPLGKWLWSPLSLWFTAFFFFLNRQAKGICKYKIIFMPELWNDFFFLLLSIFFLLLFSSVLFTDICKHAVIGKMLSEHIWSKSNCRCYAVYIMMVSYENHNSLTPFPPGKPPCLVCVPVIL